MLASWCVERRRSESVNPLSTIGRRIVANSARTLLGRRNLVRLGRFISNEARLDLPNGIDRNGERLIQKLSVRRASASAPGTVFDVGANVGKWTESLLSELPPGAAVQVHLFEPCAATFHTLQSNISARSYSQKTVLNHLALSSTDGTATLYSSGANRGTNSLYAGPKDAALLPEQITLERCDSYCHRNKITHIDLLKIDAEGHDLEVLLGAREMLERGAINAVQFEYNWRWVNARRFLKDAFDLLLPFGYSLGKLTPKGVEFYDNWDFELETFREANFVALRSELRGQVPQVKWWKTR